MRGKITKRSVDALKAAADGAEAVLWDSELKGFGVRVQRGGAKSYVLHYRAGSGQGAPLRKLTIGRHGSPWTPETARKEAKTSPSTVRRVPSAAPRQSPRLSRRSAFRCAAVSMSARSTVGATKSAVSQFTSRRGLRQ